MPEAILRLKRGRERARLHPWIFKGDVADVTTVPPGAEVTVVDAGGRFVGRGLFNPRPALCCRIVTWQDEPVDTALLTRRLAGAIARRPAPTDPERAARLVWSEADGLPGLVVDRYGPVVVVQSLTLAMAERRATVVRAVREQLGDLPVFSADDPSAAALEGFDPRRGWVDVEGPPEAVVDEAGVRLAVRFGAGQKTGLYLDQAANRARVAAHAAGHDVLDVFAYAGAFACHALRRGARRALCLESSPDAIASAGANLALNGVVERAEVRAVNAFDELRRLDRTRARFGLVVVDPPPFARSRSAVEAALRGYKEVNLRAMRVLSPGGVLATFSCSHHVSEADLEEVCRDAAADVGLPLRVLDRLGQAPDHPVLLNVPETRYLKGLLLEAV